MKGSKSEKGGKTGQNILHWYVSRYVFCLLISLFCARCVFSVVEKMCCESSLSFSTDKASFSKMMTEDRYAEIRNL